MKSPHCSCLLKCALLIVLLALCLDGSTVAQAGGKDDPLSPGPIRPGNLDIELSCHKDISRSIPPPTNSTMVTRCTFHTALMPSTRSTESPLKTSRTNVSPPMKFPRLWRCPLELTPS